MKLSSRCFAIATALYFQTACSTSYVIVDVSGCHVDAGVLDSIASTPGQQACSTSHTAASVGRWFEITPPVVRMSTTCDCQPPETWDIAVDPGTSVVYLGTKCGGVWESTDCGDHWTKINTGLNGAHLDTGTQWAMALDPVDHTVYVVNGWGDEQGLWKWIPGTGDWVQVFTASSNVQAITSMSAPVVQSITVDGTDHLHLLVGTQGFWPDPAHGSALVNAGLLQSSDGGQTWSAAYLPSGEMDYSAWQLGDRATWLVGTDSDGLFRTADSGQTWSQVTTGPDAYSSSSLGIGAQMYRTDAGVFYVAVLGGVARSVDGIAWTRAPVFGSDTGSAAAVVGDGTTLYTMQWVATPRTGLGVQFYVSPESDGMNWVPFNDQRFSSGPKGMAADRAHHIVYSSNVSSGLLRLFTQ